MTFIPNSILGHGKFMLSKLSIFKFLVVNFVTGVGCTDKHFLRSAFCFQWLFSFVAMVLPNRRKIQFIVLFK